MNEVVVLTPGQLEELVASAVERASQKSNGWLDAAGIAEHLGVSEKTVHNRTGPNVADPIPCHTLTPGGRKMFDRAEVDEWLRRRP
jgi:hypothetical protein